MSTNGPNWTGTPLEAMAQALMAATGPDGIPVLCLDPDFNELPDREHMLDDDEYCREDIEALAAAALEQGERQALLQVRSFIAMHGTKEVSDYCAQRLHDIRMDARHRPASLPDAGSTVTIALDDGQRRYLRGRE